MPRDWTTVCTDGHHSICECSTCMCPCHAERPDRKPEREEPKCGRCGGAGLVQGPSVPDPRTPYFNRPGLVRPCPVCGGRKPEADAGGMTDQQYIDSGKLAADLRETHTMLLAIDAKLASRAEAERELEAAGSEIRCQCRPPRPDLCTVCRFRAALAAWKAEK